MAVGAGSFSSSSGKGQGSNRPEDGEKEIVVPPQVGGRGGKGGT